MMRYALKLGMTLTEFYECTQRDLFNFIQAGIERRNEEQEQNYDYTRRIMWASIVAMQGSGSVKVHDLIPLKRDGKIVNLTKYEKQELDRWSAQCDEDMKNFKPK